MKEKIIRASVGALSVLAIAALLSTIVFLILASTENFTAVLWMLLSMLLCFVSTAIVTANTSSKG